MKTRIPAKPAQRGVSIIEIMIGMTVALMTTVVISQVVIQTDGQRRGSTAVADSQINGTLSLHALQREIMRAGFGFSERMGMFGCPLLSRVGVTDYNTRVLEPLRIVNGGAEGQSDTITVLSSGQSDVVSPMRVTREYLYNDLSIGVSATMGVRSVQEGGVGDMVAIIPAVDDAGKPCTLHQVDDVNSGAISPTSESVSIMPAAGYKNAATVVNLGRNAWRTYSVDARDRLVELAFEPSTQASAAPQEMFPNVVNLQAYYGRTATSADTDNTVVAYDTQQPTTPQDWRRVRTVKLVVLTKSTQREKDEVTKDKPVHNVGTNPAVSDAKSCPAGQAGNCIDLKVDNDPDWKHYRYRVYDTVIPLRNLLWNLHSK
jgi:type IV pilus assembly protein PilW